MAIGADVNFGALTRDMFSYLDQQDGVALDFNQEVRDLSQRADSRWQIQIHDRATGANRDIETRFVFIGAGGGSLPLLLQSGIPRARATAGSPSAGSRLRCTDPAIIERHNAKVYGRAAVGSPPMSVPHLDTRLDRRQAGALVWAIRGV